LARQALIDKRVSQIEVVGAILAYPVFGRTIDFCGYIRAQRDRIDYAESRLGPSDVIFLELLLADRPSAGVGAKGRTSSTGLTQQGQHPRTVLRTTFPRPSARVQCKASADSVPITKQNYS
jgi:hypothetical protein